MAASHVWGSTYVGNASSISFTMGGGAAGSTQGFIIAWRSDQVVGHTNSITAEPSGFSLNNTPTLWTDGISYWAFYTKKLTSTVGSGPVSLTMSNAVDYGVAAFVVDGDLDVFSDEAPSRSGNGTTTTVQSVIATAAGSLLYNVVFSNFWRNFTAPGDVTLVASDKADNSAIAFGRKAVDAGATGTQVWSYLNPDTGSPLASVGRAIAAVFKPVAGGGGGGGGGGGLPAGWQPLRDPTARTNTRWVNPATGSDSNDGLTKATAWKTIKVTSVPANTTIIIADGAYTLSDSIYSNYGVRPTIANNITIRSETLLGAVITGTSGSGNAATVESGSDLEFYGLHLIGWGDSAGNGLFTFHAGANFKVIGCKLRNIGNGAPSTQDHVVYTAGDASYNNACAGGQLMWCDIDGNVSGMGAALLHSWANGGGYQMHDWEVAYNTVRGTGWNWGIILGAGYAAGSPARLHIHHNDIRISVTNTLLHFYSDRGMGVPNSGLDSGSEIHHNIFVVTGGGGTVMKRENVAGTAHSPNLHDNIYWHAASGTVLSNISLGTNDQIVNPDTLATVTTTITGAGELPTSYSPSAMSLAFAAATVGSGATTTVTARDQGNRGLPGVALTSTAGGTVTTPTDSAGQATFTAGSVGSPTTVTVNAAYTAPSGAALNASGTVSVVPSSSDTTAPSVTLLASSTTVTSPQTVTLTATASDAVGVQFAKLFRNNVQFGPTVSGAGPFTFPVVINTIADNGTYAFVAKAYDAAGNEGVSSTVTVTVALTDQVPPIVSISSNNVNLTAPGGYTIQVSATDNVGVVSSKLFLNGSQVGSVNAGAGPWSFPFTVTGASDNGTYVYQAKAYDAAGNEGTSAELSVVVNIAVDVTAPALPAPAYASRYTRSLPRKYNRVTETWASKLQNEVFPVAFDFTLELGPNETLASAVMNIGVIDGNDPAPTDMLWGSPGLSGAFAQIWLRGGSADTLYWISCRVITSAGRHLDTAARIRVLPV